MLPTPDEPEIPGVVGRRSARLSIIVPITVHGTDATGQSFKENTWTISVNKHGGRIATFHRLAVDDQISIENPLLGRSARGRVNRVSEKRFAEDPFEVCVEFLEAQNVWGVRLPPEDWEKERHGVLDGRKDLSPQAEPRPAATSVALPDEETKIETTHPAPGGLPVEAGEQTGGLSQFNMAVHALTRLAGEAAAPSAQPAAPRQEPGPAEAPAAPVENAGLAACESLQQTIHEAQSLKDELNALLDRMQTARGEVENLLSRTTKASEEFQSQIEGARRSSEDSLRQSLEAMRQEIQADTLEAGTQARKICKEESGTAVKAISVCVDSAVDLLNRAGDEAAARVQGARQTLELSLKKAEECLPHLASESASLLEKFRGEAEAFAGQLRSDFESTTRESSAKAGAAISEKLEGSVESAMEAVVRDFNKQAEEALELLKEGLRSGREQCVEETQKQLATARESALTALESEAAEKSASYREQLRAALVEMQAQQTKEMEEGIQASLEGLLQTLRGKIQETQGQCVEETAKQLSAARESALTALESEATEKSASYQEQLRAALLEMHAQQTTEMGTEIQASLQGLLESLQVKIQTTEEHCVEETAKQLAVLRESTLSLLESEAAEKSASYREQLRATLVDTQAQQTKEMERGIQATFEPLLQSLRARIESTAEEAAARLAAEVRNGADQALQELPERLSQSVEMALFVVKEWEQQTRTELDAHSRRLLEAFDRRLEALSAAAQMRQRSEAEAFKSLLQDFLNHAEALSAESSQAKAAVPFESAEAPSRPAQPSAEPSTPALENLLEKQRKIIEGTLGAFRSKLGQTLAGTAPKR
ncbi:hypothetical protein SBA2_270057 [Acidobacteriia bacterium SbA2]|nr:hypothetical protein SBA2_270057 [Acidobacteriia bacterium SbA2]